MCRWEETAPDDMKDKTASSTVCTNSVFITAAIEAGERCRTAVVDLPGAYISANMHNKEEIVETLIWE